MGVVLVFVEILLFGSVDLGKSREIGLILGKKRTIIHSEIYTIL